MKDKLTSYGVLDDFSLVLGGPLYQLYLRSGLLRAPIDLVERRVVAGMLITWLPLLILAVLDGNAFRGVELPFLADIDAHIRLLLALPLLIGAELVVHSRIHLTVKQFLDRGIIADDERARFDQIIRSSIRWRSSAAAEIVLLAGSTVLGYWLWRHEASLHISTWYAVMDKDGGQYLTGAGIWYAFVSLNLLRFVLLRWYYRIFIWYVFLWRVSRLHLQLNPLHPDRSGGIAFVGLSVRAFVPVLLAHSVIVSGAIANHIWHEGMKLPQFQFEMVAMVVWLMAIALIPLTFFVAPLARCRLQGWSEYGALAMQYSNDFRAKWMYGRREREELLVGSSDIQSLADLGNAHDMVQEMRVVPFNRQLVVGLAMVLALPFAPLILTMFPVNELIGRLLGKLM